MRQSRGIAAAKLATAQMDELLRPAIDALGNTLDVSERTGVYEDIGALRAALSRTKLAIDQALRIARRVDWPLSPEDRRRIIVQLSAGIAQRRAPGLPSRRRGLESSPRSIHPDESAP